MSDCLHLLPRYRAKLEALFREHLPDVEVWAYGSRVTGDSHDGSDLDLVLRGPELKETDLSHLDDFIEAVEMSTIPFIVEARDWARIPEYFHESILENYVVLVYRDGHAAMPPHRADEERSREAAETDYVGVHDTADQANWPSAPLGDLVKNLDSRRIPLSRRERSERPGPYPYYGATGVLDHVDDYLFDGLHLLVAEDGSVETPNGNPVTQLVNGQFWVNNHAHVLQGASDIETQYLYYALSAIQVRPFISGSVQGKLSQANLNRLPLPYPDRKAHRHAIARVLGALDDKIELNRRMSETLDEMARALFRSWFVDFDPVRAKAEGRPSGLPPTLDKLFPDSFEFSELGEIPAGWWLGTLSDSIDIAKGLSYKGSGLSSDGVPLHNLNSIYEGGGYKLRGLKYYSGNYQSRHLVESGDIIVANTEQGHERLLIGFAAIIPDYYGPRGLFSHHLYRVRPHEITDLTPDYIFHLFNSCRTQQTVSAYATGTTVNMLPLDALKIPKIVLPPRDLVKRFSSCSAAIRARQEKLVNQSETLSQLRDTLLPKLISGELGVRGIDQLAARALK